MMRGKVAVSGYKGGRPKFNNLIPNLIIIFFIVINKLKQNTVMLIHYSFVY